MDDETVNLQVAANFLAVEGFTHELAAGGNEVLRRDFSNGRPELILLDIMMPEITGYEVCRRLRERFSPAELPIIMVTAKNRISDLVAGFETGANDFLTKPYAREELAARVRTHLKIKKAYETLGENIRLKGELQRREGTERELRMTQKRLSEMLDAVAEPILAVNEEGEIAFCNRPFQALTGHAAVDLLGEPASLVFKERFIEALKPDPGSESHASGGDAQNHREVAIILKDLSTITRAGLLTTIEVNETLLFMVIFPGKGAGAQGSATIPPLALLTELNRNRQRIRELETSLETSLPLALSPPPDHIRKLMEIDTALEKMGRILHRDQEKQDKRQLAFRVMTLSVAYWEETARKPRSEMARESKIWKVYTNRDGWDRTQTLDKYLDINTMPTRPRYAQVLKTADFVLASETAAPKLREELEAAVENLRRGN